LSVFQFLAKLLIFFLDVWMPYTLNKQRLKKIYITGRMKKKEVSLCSLREERLTKIFFVKSYANCNTQTPLLKSYISYPNNLIKYKNEVGYFYVKEN
jgi:hypothetical protein